MTLEELNRHFALREQLAKAKDMLDSLRAAACPGAQILTGMPHTSNVSDKVGDLAVEIADLESSICSLMNEITREESRINTSISAIEDNQTRMIFRLRFIHCMTWFQVADAIGGRNTVNNVKNICYRYLKTCVGVCRDDA